MAAARSRATTRLNWRKIEALGPGTHEDGGGLQLLVDANGNRRWQVRVTIAGRRVMRGLGGYRRSELAAVRKRAQAVRDAARDGRDLIAEEKGVERGRAELETFEQTFQAWWVHKKQTLRNSKARQQWENTIADYVFPHIGRRPVAEIAPDEIIAVLEPIWRTKPETASRVLQRMRTIFDVAIVRQVRTTANPCTGITTVLGPIQKDVRHHRAVPWQDVHRFLCDLRAGSARPATRLCLEWVILTACRSGEARGATWAEIDLGGRLWTIPAQRMKAGRAHRVPLSGAALAVLGQSRRMWPDAVLIFPAPRGGELSDNTLSKLMRDMGEEGTPHGFRTAFRTWAAESGVPDRVAEAALAHADPNKVQAAYQRSDFLDERSGLMEAWARLVNGQAV